jgi:hypothetical protein
MEILDYSARKNLELILKAPTLNIESIESGLYHRCQIYHVNLNNVENSFLMNI